MRKLLFFFLCVLSLPIMASHIVGGEFELLYQGNYFYKINLIMYYDETTTNEDLAGIKESEKFINVIVFRSSDDARVETIQLGNRIQTFIDYTQPACSIGEVKTSRQSYTTTVRLDPAKYNDPQGYYIVWERCCRNYSINNIFSTPADVPNAKPAGQTFYLKFPPVIKNGQPFINSSVASFKPLSDYACPDKPYYADFSGTDADGDLIVYSVTEPLSTHSSNPYPVISPEPYPKVLWRPSFSINNIMGGKRNLKITPNGFLTVTPGIVGGLYVFAIKCEEFRNGEKIGETRRDFQLYVSGSCADDVPPEIVGRKKGTLSFTSPDAPLNVSFERGLQERCIEVKVTDADAQKLKNNFQEKITLRAIPLNFNGDINNIIIGETAATLTNNTPKIFTLCFDKCPYIDGPFKIGVLAFDDACALPLGDTLYVTVTIEKPQKSEPPKFTPNVTGTPNITDTLIEGQEKKWQIEVIDEGADEPFVVTINPKGFMLDKAGMEFKIKKQIASLYQAELSWNAKCEGYDFSNKTDFDIDVVLAYTDSCNFLQLDTMTFNLKVIPQASPPIIYTSLDTVKTKRNIKVNRNVYDELIFSVTGEQAENNYLKLKGSGKDFSLTAYNISFPAKEGVAEVSSQFKWTLDCNKINLAVKDSFDIEFIVVDNTGLCKIYQADTLDVMVKVSPPINNTPLLSVNSLDPINPLVNNELSIELGQQITLVLTGNDGDINPLDSIQIKLVEATGSVVPQGYEFKPVKGVSPITAFLTWLPDCSIFENNVFENTYHFTFSLTDNRCFNSKADTVAVNLTIHDVEANQKDFLPTNFITPNNDGCNDYFAMEGIEIENSKCPSLSDKPDEMVSLPKDNCTGRFVNIQIYDRWGKEVFLSNQRNFRWYASDVGVGVYYYYLNYSNKQYKGAVTVRL